MQVYSKIEQAGIRIEEIGQSIQAMASDGLITPDELKSLLCEAHELSRVADSVEDISLDLQVAARVMKHGRDRAVNPHLKCRIFDLAQVREARQRETAEGTNPPAA